MLNHLLLGQALIRTPRYPQKARVKRTASEQWRAFLHRRKMAREHAPTR